MPRRKAGSPPPGAEPDPAPAKPGETYNLSGDFRNAVVNIKSTIVGAEEVRDIETLPPEAGASPYLGLQYFTEQDADHFFGRELLTAHVINHLAQSRCLTVIGASGSGKSSLVRAGVIPALRRGAALADGSPPPTNSSRWAVRLFTPSAHPLMALGAALSAEGDALTRLTQDLLANPAALGPAVRGLLAKETCPELLLVVDQFEEVFTQCHDEAERLAFIQSLVGVVDGGDQPVHLILVLRADYYASLAQYDKLREMASTQQEFIGAMSRDELFRAIVQPAALGKWKIQEGLVELMLDDTGSEPGALPLLSHALLETWNHRRGRTLTLSAYRESGGVRRAIAQTAEQVFRQRLTPAQQAVARMIFIHLVDLENNSLDTRRRAAFSELITRASDPLTINAVLAILTDARLVTTGLQEPGDVQVIEVAHEALIREWPTLREWLAENRAGLILHRQLTEAAAEWLGLARDPGALYRGARLRQAQTWAAANAADLSLSEQDFLDASQKVEQAEAARDQQLKRTQLLRRLIAPGLGIAILGILGVLFYLSGSYVFYLPPPQMDGLFNIAVAEFGLIGPDGKVTAAPQGAGLTTSGWVAAKLHSELTDPNIWVWQDGPELRKKNGHIGRVEGSTQAERIQAAQAAAARLKANMVVFGNIDTRKTPAELQLEFWMVPPAGYDFADLHGAYQVAAPVEIVDPAHPGIEAQPAINAQASTLAWLALGLNQMRFGQSAQALGSFRSAEKFSPDSAAVQFFIGRESLFLSDRDPTNQDGLTTAAEQAFQKAVSLDPNYANAYIGLGSTYFARAKRLVQAPDSAAQRTAAANLVTKARDAYAQALKLPPAAKTGSIPLDLYARLGDGTALRLQGEIQYGAGQVDAGRTSLQESVQELEAIVQPFKNAQEERVLAQTYETLGTAYQWLGFLAETVNDRQTGAAQYTLAARYYDLCTTLGNTSADQIVREDIAAQLCTPYRKDVQKRLDVLAGGS